MGLLCSLGANVNLTRKSKASPVYIAAQKGFDDILRVLVAHKANINLTNENGATQIYIAALKANNGIIRTLVDLKANVNQFKQNGASPILIAAQKGHLETCQLLVELGADLNPRRKDGVTPFFVALWEKQFHVTKWYLEKGVSLEWSLKLLNTFPNLVDAGKQWLIDEMESNRRKEILDAVNDLDSFTLFPNDLTEYIVQWEIELKRLTISNLLEYAKGL